MNNLNRLNNITSKLDIQSHNKLNENKRVIYYSAKLTGSLLFFV